MRRHRWEDRRPGDRGREEDREIRREEPREERRERAWSPQLRNMNETLTQFRLRNMGTSVHNAVTVNPSVVGA